MKFVMYRTYSDILDVPISVIGDETDDKKVQMKIIDWMEEYNCWPNMVDSTEAVEECSIVPIE